MNNVIIFGGSGFIGTHYSKKLIREGFSVYCVDVEPPRFSDDNLVFIRHDVRDLDSLNLDVEIGVIYNFAAIHTTPGHPVFEYYETNIAGAISVCAFAERHKVNEVVFTSSISVYGPGEEQKDEYDSLVPNSAYGYSKVLAEKVHEAWLKRCENHRLTIVRPAVVFGSGEGGNFTRLAYMMRKGVFVYPGRKDTIKACIYVEDLLFAIEKARETEKKFELLNGAYVERYTLEQIIEAFKVEYFPKARLFFIPKLLVLGIARVLRIFNFLNLGIHPDRVEKLVRSTNIYPAWLAENNIEIPGDLVSALARWSDETSGRFD
ncbi:NAD(P)-dependent oxidoreductase [Pontibacterium sp. N1Y112]|uniref:NAD(P)-dependent oxidoreductase n=1 Tax=Pontibacterium sinense TaxID=2781979 RepID=A0A8J7JZ64_9GAMM|nr:NAD(P)-dependent oxidoreductase [Pontibacterium sinense]MBE9398403.1 NAD(P)-dependent oxidoreductase [Pontibacterium sinense]